jgi:hypothetical protein
MESSLNNNEQINGKFEFSKDKFKHLNTNFDFEGKSNNHPRRQSSQDSSNPHNNSGNQLSNNSNNNMMNTPHITGVANNSLNHNNFVQQPIIQQNTFYNPPIHR